MRLLAYWAISLAALTACLSFSANAQLKFRGTNIYDLPDQALLAYERGNKSEEAGAYREAISAYKEAIKIQPFYPEAHLYIGRCYYHLNDLENAKIFYRKAIKQWPDYAMAHFLLANVYFHEKNYAFSEKYFKRTIGINPKFSEAYTNLASIYLLQNKHQKAEESLLVAYELFPDNPKTLSNLGNLYFIKKDYPKAIEQLTRAKELAPKNPTTLLLLGNAYLEQKKYKIALESYEKSLEHRSLASTYGSEALYGLGLTHYRMKNYVKSEKAFSKLIAPVTQTREGSILPGENPRVRSIHGCDQPSGCCFAKIASRRATDARSQSDFGHSLSTSGSLCGYSSGT